MYTGKLDTRQGVWLRWTHSSSWASQQYLLSFFFLKTVIASRRCFGQKHIDLPVLFSHLARVPCRPAGPVGRNLPIPHGSNIGQRKAHSPSQLVGWMGWHGAEGREVLQTTSRQLMNQVASLPLHVGFKHIFILLQLNSYSLGYSQDC